MFAMKDDTVEREKTRLQRQRIPLRERKDIAMEGGTVKREQILQ